MRLKEMREKTDDDQMKWPYQMMMVKGVEMAEMNRNEHPYNDAIHL